MTEKTRRMTIDMTDEQQNSLHEIKVTTGASSKAAVVRKALDLFSRVHRTIRKGGKMQLVSKDGTRVEIIVL